MKIIFLIASLFSLLHHTSGQRILPYLGKDQKYSFVDADLKPVSTARYSWVDRFPLSGYWKVERDGLYVILDTAGKEVYAGSVRPMDIFVHGQHLLATVRSKGKYGWIGLNSKINVAPAYDDVIFPPEVDAVIIVNNGLAGAVTVSGKPILPVAYRSVRFINDSLARVNESWRIINTRTKKEYELNVTDSIVSTGLTFDFIITETKTKKYLTPIALVHDKNKTIEVQKYISWQPNYTLVNTATETLMIDDSGNVRKKLPRLQFTSFADGKKNLLLIQNGETTYVMDKEGSVDSLKLPMEVLGVINEGVYKRKDSARSLYYFKDGKLVTKPFEAVYKAGRFTIKQSRYRAEVFDDKNQNIFSIDSAEYYNYFDNLLQFYHERTGDKTLYLISQNKSFRQLYGENTYMTELKENKYFIVRSKNSAVIYDTTFKELYRADDVYSITSFGNIMAISGTKKMVRFIDTRNWQPFPYILRESQCAYKRDHDGFVVVEDQPNYYINRDGKVLKENP